MTVVNIHSLSRRCIFSASQRPYSKSEPNQLVPQSKVKHLSKTSVFEYLFAVGKTAVDKVPAIDLKDIVQKFTRFDSKAVSANIKIGRNQVKHEKDDSDNSVNAESSASTIQNVIGALWKSSERKQAIPKWKQKARPIVSKESIDARTKRIIHALARYRNDEDLLVQLDDFCQHLFAFPQARWVAVREGVTSLLLKVRESKSDTVIQSFVREALALVGYLDPPDAPGLRVLSLDGGGTRGVLIIRILELIEELTGRPTYQNFDYICGVSTGAILALLLGIHKKPLAECDYLYRKMGTQVFSRNRSDAISSLVRSHAYYDTLVWEKALQDSVGFEPMVKCTRSGFCPKVGVVSSVVNQDKAFPYIFRNYNLPPRHQSRYHGSSRHRSWEATRASSAAPGYFSEFSLEDNVHQDGGLLTNNPTSIAIHEAKNLWPRSKIHCVVSIGTGRNQPLSTMEVAMPTGTSLKQKLVKVIDSATDTERVHNILHDLLPPRSYFRFNPYLTQVYGLDEVDPSRLDSMLRDVDMYLRKNENKLKKCCDRLKVKRGRILRGLDWIEEKRIMHQPEVLRNHF
ncbi:calcium-independent phospholipase A2-gamma-like isoform X2 [Artemia franciscana]|uniref:calcium-independent phospholipase A2-gamma-like isoform X2 n=1 Tax=Artemia franciscana TaxID=6661 RepID=UPI0032D9E6FD